MVFNDVPLLPSLILQQKKKEKENTRITMKMSKILITEKIIIKNKNLFE